jgi:hypothetical protein
MDEVIDYVMETPGNTNPNVLRGMLQNSSGGGNVLVVKVKPNTETGKPTMNKTWKEIFDAVCVSIYIINNGENYMHKYYATLSKVEYHINRETGNLIYIVKCINYSDEGTDPEFSFFTTDSENGYPELSV